MLRFDVSNQGVIERIVCQSLKRENTSEPRLPAKATTEVWGKPRIGLVLLPVIAADCDDDW